MMVVMVTTMMVVDVFTTFRGTEKSLIDPKNRMSSLLRLRMGWRGLGLSLSLSFLSEDWEGRVLLRTMRIIMSGGGGVAKTSKAIRSLSRKQEIRQSSSEDRISYYSHVVS